VCIHFIPHSHTCKLESVISSFLLRSLKNFLPIGACTNFKNVPHHFYAHNVILDRGYCQANTFCSVLLYRATCRLARAIRQTLMMNLQLAEYVTPCDCHYHIIYHVRSEVSLIFKSTLCGSGIYTIAAWDFTDIRIHCCPRALGVYISKIPWGPLNSHAKVAYTNNNSLKLKYNFNMNYSNDLYPK